jgi:hypothetical protein
MKAMEHALSLETRVGPLPQATDDSEPPPPLADSPASASPTPKTTPMQRASGKTAALDKSPGVTAPLDPADGNGDRRAAGDAPTLATSGGSSSRSRTAMGTQAGKATGSVHARSTEAAGEAGAASSKLAEPAPKATRFTTVSEDELRGQREADDASVRQWIIVGGLAAVAAAVIGMTVFLATRPPTADDLYEAVKQAADADGGEGLAAVDDSLHSMPTTRGPRR